MGIFDNYDDDFDDEPEPRGSLFKKKDKKYDYDLGDDGASGSEKVKPVKQQPARIMPMRSKKGAAGMEVCVFKPTQFDESREITDTLLNGCTVVLNFEGLDVEIAQRIIVTPKSVDISGDFQEILSGAFDIPTI